MISYYMTHKGKLYYCHLCGSPSWSIVALKIDGIEVQFCDECWRPEYVTLAQSKDVELKGDEKVNENMGLSN